MKFSGGGRREYRDARPGPPGGGYQRNYGGGGDRGYNRRRDNYSPPRRHNDMSPPNKRMRGNDWLVVINICLQTYVVLLSTFG